MFLLQILFWVSITNKVVDWSFFHDKKHSYRYVCNKKENITSLNTDQGFTLSKKQLGY